MAEQKLVKLRTGEELIANFTNNSNGTVTFFDALAIHLIPTGNPNDPMRLALTPAFPLAKNPRNVTIEEANVFWVLDPDDSLAAEHRRITVQQTTGLILPTTR
jgi:hypothetical protein